ncbi:hypothetical protein DSM104299_01764 [Baekduia alba]|uniref:lysylphosphatidylglycerol synthase transmembrane domain-containing protein n=1 Tax=Baekduia alba TaxID=2997333 RepID=UPI0023425DE9|nr:YbhN family protein [Baekduia alba]WCB93062.1 hypothetical protein DSM104299_01764 [Baekduia alba]
MAAPVSSVGDRLERAIEQRTELEDDIARGETSEPERRHLVRTAIWLGLTAISLYLVAPSLLDVLSSWKDIARIGVGWLLVMAACQALSLGSLWVLQRLAIRARRWAPVITSQLAGNAMSKIAPGGGAVGAAVQYRMLVDAGLERTTVVGGLTAANLLTFALVLAMPVLAIPALIRGAVPRDLVNATVVGVVAFAVLAVAGAVCLRYDAPLRGVGRAIQRVRNRLRRHAEPLRGLPSRLLRERDRILTTLGPQWLRALLATTGRWAFDYGSLLAALAAVGSHPRAALVLLAFCAAQLLAQIPITPGGLGFVEAGLTAMLTLAGVSAGNAVLATFAYRLVSYWLPLPVGLVAYVVHRRTLKPTG